VNRNKIPIKVEVVDDAKGLYPFERPNVWLESAKVEHRGGARLGEYVALWPSLVFTDQQAYIHAEVISYQGVKLLAQVRGNYPSIDRDREGTADIQFFDNDQYAQAKQWCIDWIENTGRPWMDAAEKFAAWINADRRIVVFQNAVEALTTESMLYKFSAWLMWIDNPYSKKGPIKLAVPNRLDILQTVKKHGGKISSKYVGAGPRLPRHCNRSLLAYAGPAWRAETGYRHDPETTIADVVRYEQDELMNNLGVPNSVLEELGAVPAQNDNVVWVTKRKVDAERYGMPAPFKVRPGARILAYDGEGGYLLLNL